MKKDKKILFLFVFFAALFFSHSAMAHGPNQCCKLNHNLTEIDDPACDTNHIVAPTTSKKYWCDTNDNGIHDVDEQTIHVTKKWGECCVVDSIYNITDWLFYALMAGIAILFTIAGFLFVSAGGDTSKISNSKKFIFYGVIGLVLALMARIIPGIIKAIVS